MGYRNRILVEGIDDQHVVGHLLEQHQIDCLPENICNRLCQQKKIHPHEYDGIVLKQFGGDVQLLRAFVPALLDNDVENLAIILDADTDLMRRWTQVGNILRKSGTVTLPDVPNREGTIVELEQIGRTLTIGIWLMPNNTLPGILEDFIQLLVPENDDLWPYALGCVDRIGEERCRYPDVRRSKAEIHTWLAWQDEPGKSLGVAIKSKVLDPHSAQSAVFVAWINRLFGNNQTVEETR